MDTTVFELTMTILAAVGDAGAAVIGLASWLGKV